MIRSRYRRRALLESLERRDLLAAAPFGTNSLQKLDVTRDGQVSAVDALRVINALRLSDEGIADPAVHVGDFIDTTGDGRGTALDALRVINGLGRQTPLIAATLPNDSAPRGETNLDLLTSSYEINLNVNIVDLDDRNVFLRIDGSGEDPFVDITDQFSQNTATLTPEEIDGLVGEVLEDGDHRFEVRIGDTGDLIDFTLTVDRAAPTALVDVDDTVRSTFDNFAVRFNEAVAASLDEESFEFKIDGGSQSGESVDVESANFVNDSTFLVKLPEQLPDQGYRFEILDAIEDLAGNRIDAGAIVRSFVVADPPGIESLSPAAGEELVSVTRETIVRFDEPVDPDTIDEDSFYVIANGTRVAGTTRVSSTEKFATILYDDPLPASTEIRIVVDGSKIIGRDGFALDANGDDEPGGLQNADFRTLPLTTIPGTNVFGFVRDSVTEEPIIGATIRVDSLPDKNVVTDENGRFELVDMPAPDFFVHIDGTTATNLEDGYVYPNVGKPFHSEPGQTTQINMDGEAFDIFLPPLKETDIQALSATETTTVGFGDDGLSRLEGILPNIDPSFFGEFGLMINPGAAIDDAGTPATTAAIIPVEPDRIPAPLPSFLDPELVVSIQAPGATSFDVPPVITFPNLDGLAPGEKSAIFSFDHDAGRWKVVGTGTVSEDRRRIVSDGGVIQAPGWHLTQSGSQTKGSFKDFADGPASVTISGTDRIFSMEDEEATITISNTSDKAVSATITLDGISEISKTGRRQDNAGTRSVSI